jgi:uncharacterized protein YbjT (DUF2867 family)
MSTVLVTGGTGFVGRALIDRLVEAGLQVRVLVRPSTKTPNLPRGAPVDVVVTSLQDERGLRAGMVGVDAIYHLASAEWRGAYESLLEIDIQGTQLVSRVAAEAGVDRLIYLSHLGADRASAYPVLKAKAIAEEYVRRSGVDHTIIRSAITFGPDDGFTTGLGFILSTIPGIFLMPGDGKSLLQPLSIDDLATCLAWVLDEPDSRNQLYEVGGPEYLSLQQCVAIVTEALDIRRTVIHTTPLYLRWMTVLFESIFPGTPVSIYWLDYLSANRTCSLDTLPRQFQLMPARFSVEALAYLKGVNWRQILWHVLSTRRIRRPRRNR